MTKKVSRKTGHSWSCVTFFLSFCCPESSICKISIDSINAKQYNNNYYYYYVFMFFLNKHKATQYYYYPQGRHDCHSQNASYAVAREDLIKLRSKWDLNPNVTICFACRFTKSQCDVNQFVTSIHKQTHFFSDLAVNKRSLFFQNIMGLGAP